MATHTKSAYVEVTRHGPGGVPFFDIVVPPNASLEQVQRIQKSVLKDAFPKAGLKSCETCHSGGVIRIRELMGSLIHVDLEQGVLGNNLLG
jgi:hypothetical protein